MQEKCRSTWIHKLRSCKLNFSDSPAYNYLTVLYKSKISTAFFCEKTPKKALSTLPPSRFVASYIHLRARHALIRRPRRVCVFPRPQNWFQQLLENIYIYFFFEPSQPNTIQGIISVVNSLRPRLVSFRK